MRVYTVYAKCLEKRCRKNQSWGYPVRLSLLPLHFRPNFHSPANFREILRIRQRCLHLFFRPQESMRRGPREKFGKFFRTTVLTAACYWPFQFIVFLLRGCIHISGIRSKSLTVNVGIRQGCVLLPLLIIYMN